MSQTPNQMHKHFGVMADRLNKHGCGHWLVEVQVIYMPQTKWMGSEVIQLRAP